MFVIPVSLDQHDRQQRLGSQRCGALTLKPPLLSALSKDSTKRDSFRAERIEMDTSILGIGTALPEHTMSLDEAVEMSTELICRTDRESRLLRTMYRKARVQIRRTCVPYQIAYKWIGKDALPSSSPGPTTQERMALYAEHARPLATLAATRALESAGIAANEITHMVTVSCTGFDAPGVDIHLFDELGLRNTTQRLHIGFMGCHGAINGLRAARGLAAVDPDARILLCAVELCSLHFKFQWDPERMLGNALFADGAAALVVGQSQSSASEICRVRDTGSCLLSDSREAITWNVGDFGFDMSLSNRVPDLIGEQLKPWLVPWLESRGHSLKTIESWAVHPGGPRILDAVQEALGLDSTALATSNAVLSEHGNMSSPTVLFILERFLQQAVHRPCLLLGFGPGMMAEVALLE
jgi:predicted naringenin-chalcone synthase